MPCLPPVVACSTEGELQQLLLLPANVWSLFEVAEDGSVISEAGWYGESGAWSERQVGWYGERDMH